MRANENSVNQQIRVCKRQFIGNPSWLTLHNKELPASDSTFSWLCMCVFVSVCRRFRVGNPLSAHRQHHSLLSLANSPAVRVHCYGNTCLKRKHSVCHCLEWSFVYFVLDEFSINCVRIQSRIEKSSMQQRYRPKSFHICTNKCWMIKVSFVTIMLSCKWLTSPRTSAILLVSPSIVFSAIWTNRATGVSKRQSSNDGRETDGRAFIVHDSHLQTKKCVFFKRFSAICRWKEPIQRFSASDILDFKHWQIIVAIQLTNTKQTAALQIWSVEWLCLWIWFS